MARSIIALLLHMSLPEVNLSSVVWGAVLRYMLLSLNQSLITQLLDAIGLIALLERP